MRVVFALIVLLMLAGCGEKPSGPAGSAGAPEHRPPIEVPGGGDDGPGNSEVGGDGTSNGTGNGNDNAGSDDSQCVVDLLNQESLKNYARAYNYARSACKLSPERAEELASRL